MDMRNNFQNPALARALIFTLALSVLFFNIPINKAYALTATGGTISTSGNYTIHTFTSSGTFEVTSGSGVLEYLVVGGGGGGGGEWNSGGGGGGGVVTGSGYVVNFGNSITVTVGDGGTGGASQGIVGGVGGSSIFGTITAGGGGGGDSYTANNPGAGVATNGSGGGSSGYRTSAGGVGNGTGGTGGAGSTYGAGGGGGAGANGGNGSGNLGGDGGDGVASSISGSSVYYGGGGGGAEYNLGNPGTGGGDGGLGGGGAGANSAGNPVAGTANTGGGGGGASGYDPGVNAGADGGSGIVIVRYLNTAASGQTTLSGNVLFSADITILGSLSKGSGTFVIDHPQKPRTHLLYHSFVESPDVKNIYDGIAKLDESGEATILLPSYFEALNKDFRYQYFPLFESMPGLYIKQEIYSNKFTIAGGEPGGRVSWQVTGIRHDPYILANPIIPEVEKGPDEIVNRGECIFEPLCQ